MTALWKRISYIDWPLQLGCKLSLLQDEIVELKKNLYLCLNLGATALQTNVQSRKWDDFDVFSYHNNSCVTSSPSNQNVMKYFCHKRRPLLTWKKELNQSFTLNLSVAEKSSTILQTLTACRHSLFQLFCREHFIHKHWTWL